MLICDDFQYQTFNAHRGHDIGTIVLEKDGELTISCYDCQEVLLSIQPKEGNADEPMTLESLLPDPDMVGQSEYRAIHECIHDALPNPDNVSSADQALIVAMASEFEEWARTIRIKNDAECQIDAKSDHPNAKVLSALRAACTHEELVSFVFDLLFARFATESSIDGENGWKWDGPCACPTQVEKTILDFATRKGLISP